MIVFYSDEDLEEGAEGTPVQDVTLAHLKAHKESAALPAECAYFERDGQLKSLKERDTPSSSLMRSLLLSRSELIN